MKPISVLGGFLFAVSAALVACSGGGGGTGEGTGTGTADGGSTGSGTGNKPSGSSSSSPSASSTSTSSSSQYCCLQLKYYSCPTEGDATKCFDNASPGACKADSSKDSKCCKDSGSSCSKGSDCCSGSCITDPDDPDSTICK